MATVNPNLVVQKLNITDDDLRFKTPCSMCISGPSMSGKSEFIVQLIQNKDKMFDVDFEQIFYCAPESLILRHNPIFEKIKVSFPILHEAIRNTQLPGTLKGTLLRNSLPIYILYLEVDDYAESHFSRIFF